MSELRDQIRKEFYLGVTAVMLGLSFFLVYILSLLLIPSYIHGLINSFVTGCVVGHFSVKMAIWYRKRSRGP